jgi:hypothetical protein
MVKMTAVAVAVAVRRSELSVERVIAAMDLACAAESATVKTSGAGRVDSTFPAPPNH